MILRMQDIYKSYRTGKAVTEILKDINLEVEEGEYLAIMGPSGSGKTTLMNLIGCLDVPTSGSYWFNGHDISSCSSNELADIRNKDLGFVFQSFNLLQNLTALDNVALPLLYGGMKKAERRALAAEALKTVGLEDRLEFRPDQLSGGQCQRVAIARAIVGEPKLLLADEPTGALDSTSGSQVMDLFDMLHYSGATIIMITHDPNIAKRADHIRHIYDGRLIDSVPFAAEDHLLANSEETESEKFDTAPLDISEELAAKETGSPMAIDENPTAMEAEILMEEGGDE